MLTCREGETIILETSDGPIRASPEMPEGSAAWIGFDVSQSVEILREESLPELADGWTAINTELLFRSSEV